MLEFMDTLNSWRLEDSRVRKYQSLRSIPSRLIAEYVIQNQDIYQLSQENNITLESHWIVPSTPPPSSEIYWTPTEYDRKVSWDFPESWYGDLDITTDDQLSPLSDAADLTRSTYTLIDQLSSASDIENVQPSDSEASIVMDSVPMEKYEVPVTERGIRCQSAGTRNKPKLRTATRTKKQRGSPDISNLSTEKRFRTMHNQVEKRYRKRLNSQFESLLALLPDMIEDDEQARDDTQKRRITKAVTISAAIRYIKQLVSERENLMEQIDRGADMNIVGGFI
jgi:hypothetical protein